MVYYLVTKEEFASLYRFGQIHLKYGGAVESESPQAAVEQLFSQADSFEYAQERIILSSERGGVETLNIMDIVDIYPLDSVSKNLFESQFNNSIIFQAPIFQDYVESFLQEVVLRRETANGVQALRTIFGLEEENAAFVDEIIKGKVFLQKWRKYFDVPLEMRTPFSMLIAYNRYRHYPKDLRGYFYDAPDCFMYATLTGYPDFLGFDRDIVADNCRGYQALLDSLPNDLKFVQIAEQIENSGMKICEAIGQVYGSVRFVALFFYAKDRILSNDTISIEGLRFLYAIKKKYPDDFSKIISLIGGFFGYSWVYDRLYEFSKRPFISTHHDIFEFDNPEAFHNSQTTVSCGEEPSVPNCSEESRSGETIMNPEPEDTTQDIMEGSTSKEVASNSDLTISSEQQPDNTNEQIVPKGVDSPLDIDIEAIAKAIFPKSCKRKDMFVEQLKSQHDRVLVLALARDESGLRALYPSLDKKYKRTTKSEDLNKLTVFVQSCLLLKQAVLSNEIPFTYSDQE